MNLEIVKSLSDESLNALAAAVRAEVLRRQDRQLVPGAIAKFQSSKSGEMVYIQITRLNGKSVSGNQVDEYGNPHPSKMRWRCDYGSLTIHQSPVRPAAPILRPSPAVDRPQSVGDGLTW